MALLRDMKASGLQLDLRAYISVMQACNAAKQWTATVQTWQALRYARKKE